MTHPATDLRASLSTAARAAYLDGATANQIDMLIALARGANDYRELSGGRLTKAEAARAIDEALAAGVEPDWNVTEAELDDQDATAASIEDRIAYKKATKKQKAADKARRDAELLAAAAAGSDGRRVRHMAPAGKSLGEGEVVAEDEQTVTAIFPGQRKPSKLSRKFVAFI